jgi:hypothetical protein
VLGDNPETFVSFGVDDWRIVAFALTIVIIPPTILWLASSLLSVLSARIGNICFLMTVGLLAAAAAIQLAKWGGISSRYALQLITVVGGAGMVWAYRRFPPVNTWTRYLAPLPALSLVLFLFASPAGALLGEPSPASAGTQDDHPSVVMIVLDEFPTKSLLDASGGIDAVRFPQLAEFADDATWYRRYTAMSPFTGSAVPSLLTGQVPRTDPPFFTNYPNSIFSLLGPTHDLAAFETATVLCNEPGCSNSAGRNSDLRGLLAASVDILRSRLAFGSSRDVALDDFVEGHAEVGTPGDGAHEFGELMAGAGLEAVPDRVVAFTDTFHAGGRPGFYYLHLMLPHRPWLRYDTGAAYQSPDPFGVTLPKADQAYNVWWSSWSAAVTEQRHLLQAMYTDRLIGGILERFKAAGLYDEALIVVVADHGVSFAERQNSREPTTATIGDVAFVPLLIKEPRQHDGRIDDSNLMSIDVLPTVATVVGVTPDWALDGVSAGSAAITERGERKFWYDITDAFSPELLGIVEFNDSASFPSAAERHIGPIESADDPLEGMFHALNIPNLIGSPIEDLEASPVGQAQVLGLQELRRPSSGEPPIGVVSATVRGVPAGIENTGIFVLSINGTIVTGSRIVRDSSGDLRVHTLLPEGVLRSRNELSAAVVTFTGSFGVSLVE